LSAIFSSISNSSLSVQELHVEMMA